MRQIPLLSLRLSLALLFTGLLSTSVLAGETHHRTHIVKVQTGDSEVVEADVSDLALGESRTFTTESGTTVDVLRAPEGLEVYLDGELLDTEFGPEDLHERVALIHEELELECETEDDGACEDHYAYAWSSDDEVDANVIVAREKVEIVCDGDDDCDNVFVIEDGEAVHDNGAHKIVVIRKEERTAED